MPTKTSKRASRIERLEKPIKPKEDDATDIKLDATFKYLSNLKTTSQIMTDEVALQAIVFMSQNISHKHFERSIRNHIEIVKTFANILTDYLAEFKSYVNQNDTLYLNKKAEGTERQQIAKVTFLIYVLIVLWSSAARFPFFRYKFHEHNGTKALLAYLGDEQLVKNCMRFQYSSTRPKDNQPGVFIMRAIIGTISNITKIADEIQKDLAELDAVGVLVRFSELIKDQLSHRSLAYIAIANVIRDAQIDSKCHVKLMIQNLIILMNIGAESLSDKNKVQRIKIDINERLGEVCCVALTSYYYHLIEIIEALYRLAVNDSLKLEIFEANKLRDSIFKILSHGNCLEREYALKLLWQLAFNETILRKISADKEIVAIVKRLSEEEVNKSLKNHCSGILWLLRSIEENNEAKAVSPAKKRHIFISYSRENRDFCMKIKYALVSAGHKVFIDTDNHHDSTPESMAKAVEHSHCILLCMTEKYEQNPFCRIEAEYALKNRVPIVPLILQKDYEPDSWLRVLAGSGLNADFGQYSFDECMKRVEAEISFVISSEHGGKMDEPSSWNKNQVKLWLEKNLADRDFVTIFDDYDGRMIRQLHRIKCEAPQYFYLSFANNFNMDLTKMVKFSLELEDILSYFANSK